MKSKSLAKNSMYNVLYKALNIFFPLITSVYAARILKVDSIGRVAAAQNIASYFTLIATMGIPTYGVKLIAQYKIYSRESSKSFFELFIINAILGTICSIAYYAFVLNCSYFDGKEILYSITGLNVLFNIVNIDWFYQGIQKYGYITFRSFVIKFISLFALIIFVRDENDYLAYAFINFAALAFNYIFNVIHIKKYIRWGLYNFELRVHFNHIVSLFLATIAAEVYTLADTTMLDVMCNSTTVGYYTMSMKIIKIVRSLVVAVSAVFLPQLSYFFFSGKYTEFRDLINKGIHILMVLTFPTAAGVFLTADDAIIFFYGNNFAESIVTTRILTVSIITVAFSNFIGMQILVTMGKERITTISTICGAVINMILNYILIIDYQHNGTAVASVITEAAVMIIQFVLSKKYIKLEFEIKKVFSSVACMIIAIVLIKAIHLNHPLSLLLSCFIGVLVYAAALIILKDEFIISVINVVKKYVDPVN